MEYNLELTLPVQLDLFLCQVLLSLSFLLQDYKQMCYQLELLRANVLILEIQLQLEAVQQLQNPQESHSSTHRQIHHLDYH